MKTFTHKIQRLIQENFLIDQAGTGELIPFKFRPIQQKYFDILVNDYGEDFWCSAPVREQIIKARQEGFTSLILALFASVMTLVDSASRFLEISYKIDATKQHFSRLKRFFLSLATHDKKIWTPELDRKIFQHVTEGSELILNKTFSSFYAGTATGRTGERGGNVRGVLLTESAHYPSTGVINASEIIEGTRQQIPVDTGLLFRETTANGWNHEKRTWDMAVAGEVDYKPRFFGWREFYTAEQFEKIKKGFSDKTLIPQEYPETCDDAFLFTGRPAFSPRQLGIYSKQVSDPQWIGEVIDDGHELKLDLRTDGLLKVWKAPRHLRRYLISADVAEGVKGGAYSVAMVMDLSSWDVVAIWRGHVDPGEFGLKMCELGYWYNNAVLIPENNNHGWGTIERIKAEEYPHLLDTGMLWDDPTDRAKKLGFPTNEKTRTGLISAIRSALDQLTVVLHDSVTINELKACIVDDNGKVVAQEGYFMDTVIAFGIGLYSVKFLTLDETYRDRSPNNSPVMVLNGGGGNRAERKGRRRATGY